jgi:TPR repeat protein
MNSPNVTEYLKLALTHVLVPIILVLSLAAPLAAGPFEDAVAAHNKGDYATAFRLWRPFADQGNAHAQVNLGLMYAKGPAGRHFASIALCKVCSVVS